MTGRFRGRLTSLGAHQLYGNTQRAGMDVEFVVNDHSRIALKVFNLQGEFIGGFVSFGSDGSGAGIEYPLTDP